MIASAYLTFYSLSSRPDGVWGGVSIASTYVGSSVWGRGRWSRKTGGVEISKCGWFLESDRWPEETNP